MTKYKPIARRASSAPDHISIELERYDELGVRRIKPLCGFPVADAVILRDALTAAIDAPRLAARATPEIVARSTDSHGYPIALWRTPFEWAVADYPDRDVMAPYTDWNVVEWIDGPDAERDARKLYAAERGKALCGGCSAEADTDDMQHSADGVDLCPACYRSLLDEHNAMDFAHSASCPGLQVGIGDPCDWTGKGADVKTECGGEDWLCPRCEQPVEPAVLVESDGGAILATPIGEG